MQPVVSNPPIATIYRCEHGGIHLICQNVNIGLQPGEFGALNREVQLARSLVEDGIWSCSYLSLSWHTTVMCLNATVLEPLAEAMQEAAETLGLEDIDTPAAAACPPLGPGVKVFPGPGFTLPRPGPGINGRLN